MALVCPTLRAHEGHDTPGALPPSPHGGVAAEAEHKVAHKEGAPEDELFFEAVYKNRKLEIYPLLLSPQNTAIFKELSPKELKTVEVKVEFPRTKKIENVSFALGEKAIEAKFDPKGANRFVVHVSASHKNEVKVAKVQIESR